MDDIINVQFPFFNEYVKKEYVDDNIDTYDWDPTTEEMFHEKSIRNENTITPDYVAFHDDIETLEEFKYFDYEARCEEFAEKLEVPKSTNPWIANFVVNRWCEINWAEMFDNMYTQLPVDLAKDRVKMNKAQQAWRDIIDKKADEAIDFLEGELEDYEAYLEAGSLLLERFLEDPKNIEIVDSEDTGEDNSGMNILMGDGTSKMFYMPGELEEELKEHRCLRNIHDVIVHNPECEGIDSLEEEIHVDEYKDLLLEAEQQIEEVQVIVKMIREQADEYKELTKEVKDLFSLKDTWPPILLPMPFKWKE